jgi:hypothetical protein
MTPRGCGHDRDLSPAGNFERNVHSPIGIAATEERRPGDRIEDPDPIGLTELTKFLAEETR